MSARTAREAATASTPLAVFLAFLRFGLTSFGGPVAHIGYFRDELVKPRGWLGEAEYADIVALCQFLPGPASSQLGLAVAATLATLAWPGSLGQILAIAGGGIVG